MAPFSCTFRVSILFNLFFCYLSQALICWLFPAVKFEGCLKAANVMSSGSMDKQAWSSQLLLCKLNETTNKTNSYSMPMRKMLLKGAIMQKVIPCTVTLL